MVIFFVIEALKNMIQLIKKKRPRHRKVRTKVVKKDTLSERIISYEEQYDKVPIERNSLKYQPSVAEKEINRLEYQVRSQDEEIRRLKYELALKEEETQHIKSQLDLRDKEFDKLRIAIQSACTDLGNAVTTADNAFIFRNRRPPLEKGIEKLFTEKDLSGAELSGSGQRAVKMIQWIRKKLLNEKLSGGELLHLVTLKDEEIQRLKELLSQGINDLTDQVVEKDTASKRIISYEEQYNKVSVEGNSLEHQPSVVENEINGLMNQIRLRDDEIRRLEHEPALKDEETQHLKSQLDLREEEFDRLRTAIQSACTYLGDEVTAADNAFINTRLPLDEAIENLFAEKDLLGAEMTDDIVIRKY